jgi:hypothetical protein
VTDSLAYYGSEIITTVKKFYSEAPGIANDLNFDLKISAQKIVSKFSFTCCEKLREQ